MLGIILQLSDLSRHLRTESFSTYKSVLKGLSKLSLKMSGFDFAILTEIVSFLDNSRPDVCVEGACIF